MQQLYTLNHLSDDDLVDATVRAVRDSQRSTAHLLAHLAEIDRRRLYLAKAKPSMFQYAVDVLGLSEAAAYNRIAAARAARQYPKIFELVAQGALHLSAVKLIQPHLTAENHDELLALVSHKSTRAVERELARRFPKPDAAQILRRLPAPRQTTPAAETSPLLAATRHAEANDAVAAEPDSSRGESSSPSRADPFQPKPPPTSRTEPLALQAAADALGGNKRQAPQGPATAPAPGAERRLGRSAGQGARCALGQGDEASVRCNRAAKEALSLQSVSFKEPLDCQALTPHPQPRSPPRGRA